MSDLTCKILGTTFSSPIWLGSGTVLENKERVDKFLKSKVGAMVPRTTRFKYAPDRKSHPSYHLDINMEGTPKFGHQFSTLRSNVLASGGRWV